jgi:hypothetical protein
VGPAGGAEVAVVTGLRVCFDIAAVAMWLGMLARVGGRRASRWRTGWVGKAVSLAAVALVVAVQAGWWLPVGAMLVWWRDRRRTDRFELPMADGRRLP